MAEGERLFASHADWMAQTHYREGDLALLRYNVVKDPATMDSGPESDAYIAPLLRVIGRTALAQTGLLNAAETSGAGHQLA